MPSSPGWAALLSQAASGISSITGTSDSTSLPSGSDMAGEGGLWRHRFDGAKSVNVALIDPLSDRGGTRLFSPTLRARYSTIQAGRGFCGIAMGSPCSTMLLRTGEASGRSLRFATSGVHLRKAGSHAFPSPTIAVRCPSMMPQCRS